MSQHGVRFRSIISADRATLAALTEISMLGNGYSLSDRPRWNETHAWLEGEFVAFDPQTKLLLVVLREVKIIGFARFQRQAETGIWCVQGLEVRAEERRRGVGTAMLRHGMQLLRRRGASIVISYTSKENAPALAVHRKAGFAMITDDFNRFDGSPIGYRGSWMLEARLDAEMP